MNELNQCQYCGAKIRKPAIEKIPNELKDIWHDIGKLPCKYWDMEKKTSCGHWCHGGRAGSKKPPCSECPASELYEGYSLQCYGAMICDILARAYEAGKTEHTCKPITSCEYMFVSKCSECNTLLSRSGTIGVLPNYCPNCGAKVIK